MRRPSGKSVLAGGAALALLLALGVAFGARRPDILSQGTIAFASACITALAAVAALFFLRPRPASGLRPTALDLAVLALLLWSWASYLLSPVHRGPPALAFLPVTGFAAYLLVRAAGTSVIRPRRGLLAWLFVGLAMAQAARGLSQLVAGREMKGFFFNTNHLAMFLALALPVSLALGRSARTKGLRIMAWTSVPAFFLTILASRCRSALAAGTIALSLMILVRARTGRARKRAGLVYLGAASLILVAALALSIKPASTVGRVLTWKVSTGIFLDHPFLGAGFTTFPYHFNGAQGLHFARAGGSSAERQVAGPGLYAFNDPLETAVELGVLGLALLVWLWFLVGRAGFGVFRRAGPGAESDDLDLATASIPAAYFVLSLFYYPSRILPLSLVFSVCLGWLASLSVETKPEAAAGKAKDRKSGPLAKTWVNRFAKPAAASLAGAMILLSMGLIPSFTLEFAAERAWSRAVALDAVGRKAEALALCRPLVKRLEDNADFLGFYGRLLIDNGQAAEASRALDTTLLSGTNPFVLEKLAQALENTGRLEDAFLLAGRASTMLPWRLTPKVMLAEIEDRRGNGESASRLALAALLTPLKLRTEEGLALKRKALDIWKKNGARGPSDLGDRLQAVLLLPPEYQADALTAIESSGLNAAELVMAIGFVKPDERPGLAFLLANMPDRDLRTLKARFLVENVDLAYRARRTLPWAAGVPEEIFLNDVLAYSVANEARDDWRREFFARFVPVAAVNPSIEDAVFGLNLSLISQFQLTYLERDNRGRILGPLKTIASGTVSCGEGSMLLVYACRAAGIPARLIVLPQWAHVRMGHIWVEIYDRGAWRHLPAYDVARPDKTWMEPFYLLLDPAKPRQHVLASSFKRTRLHNAFGPSVSFVDVTDAYKKKP